MAISLENLSRGKRLRAPKIVVYGGPKIGKSTFASQIPNSVFIQTEEGLDALDVTAFPLAQSFQDVLDAVNELLTKPHDFEALCVDSLDWTENLLHQHVCKLNNVDTLEKVGGGYGKGYIEAARVWRELLDKLDALRNQRGMVIVLIAHDESRRMDPPDSEPYNYSALKLHKAAAAVVEEWTDVLAHACEKKHTKKDDVGFNKKHVRAIGTDQRVLIVGKNPAFVTGNRYGLPDEIPLEWNAFVAALSAVTAPPAAAAA